MYFPHSFVTTLNFPIIVFCLLVIIYDLSIAVTNQVMASFVLYHVKCFTQWLGLCNLKKNKKAIDWNWLFSILGLFFLFLFFSPGVHLLVSPCCAPPTLSHPRPSPLTYCSIFCPSSPPTRSLASACVPSVAVFAVNCDIPSLWRLLPLMTFWPVTLSARLSGVWLTMSPSLARWSWETHYVSFSGSWS